MKNENKNINKNVWIFIFQQYNVNYYGKSDHAYFTFFIAKLETGNFANNVSKGLSL